MREEGRQLIFREVSSDRWLVYDIAPFIAAHPGGSKALLRVVNTREDAQVHYEFHRAIGKKAWRKYLVGKISRLTRRVDFSSRGID